MLYPERDGRGDVVIADSPRRLDDVSPFVAAAGRELFRLGGVLPRRGVDLDAAQEQIQPEYGQIPAAADPDRSAWTVRAQEFVDDLSWRRVLQFEHGTVVVAWREADLDLGRHSFAEEPR